MTPLWWLNIKLRAWAASNSTWLPKLTTKRKSELCSFITFPNYNFLFNEDILNGSKFLFAHTSPEMADEGNSYGTPLYWPLLVQSGSGFLPLYRVRPAVVQIRHEVPDLLGHGQLLDPRTPKFKHL